MKFRILSSVVALASVAGLAGCVSTPIYAGPSISIERSACYGRCPVYRFTLHADGSYVWEGRAHVAVAGIVHGRMDAAVFASALTLLREAHYADFNDSYQSGSTCEEWRTDSPTVTLEITDPSGPKTIVHYHGCVGFTRENNLMQLEADLDKVFKTRKFTG